MAQTSPSRIRSLQDQDAIFQAFDAYPWSKDKIFLSGLSAILGPATAPDQSTQASSSPADMAVHARIFYYAQRIGVQIDYAQYMAWLEAHPEHSPPQLASGAEELPSWQRAAPKVDLTVERRHEADADADADDGGHGQPSYPTGFAEMLKLLQEGKEIPGIRQIPNTVVRAPSVGPVGARATPKKPWEKAAAVPQQDPMPSLPTTLDAEFPPLEAQPGHVSDGPTS